MGDRCRAIDQIVHENEQALGPTNKSALFEMPLPSHLVWTIACLTASSIRMRSTGGTGSGGRNVRRMRVLVSPKARSIGGDADVPRQALAREAPAPKLGVGAT
jgi:hypothetical protein